MCLCSRALIHRCTHVLLSFFESGRVLDFWHSFKHDKMQIIYVGKSGRFCPQLGMTGSVYREGKNYFQILQFQNFDSLSLSMCLLGSFCGDLGELVRALKHAFSFVEYTGKPRANCATIVDILMNVLLGAD